MIYNKTTECPIVDTNSDQLNDTSPTSPSANIPRQKVNLLFYNTKQNCKDITINLEDNSLNNLEVLKVELLYDNSLINSYVSPTTKTIIENTLSFEMHEYVKQFNKIRIHSPNKTFDICIGTYILEPIELAIDTNTDKFNSISSLTSQNSKNSSIIKYSLDSPLKNKVVTKIPTLLENTSSFQSKIDFMNEEYILTTSINNDALQVNDINFEVILCQEDKSNSSSTEIFSITVNFLYDQNP